MVLNLILQKTLDDLQSRRLELETELSEILLMEKSIKHRLGVVENQYVGLKRHEAIVKVMKILNRPAKAIEIHQLLTEHGYGKNLKSHNALNAVWTSLNRHSELFIKQGRLWSLKGDI